ncbi:unnamed protein product [Parajaminaea phylloscopi]
MDQINNFLGQKGGLGEQINNMAGGGAEAEKKEDYLDKGIDYVQENVFKQGPQDNETAVEQAKDEAIAAQIRGQVKDRFGYDIPKGN